MVAIENYRCECGELVLASCGDMLSLCDWVANRHLDRNLRRVTNEVGGSVRECSTPVIRRAIEQLEEYFAGRRRQFDLPLMTVGTPFQQQVWKALLDIPYGETRSYMEIARKIGRPEAVRAVSQAIGANGISIFIPCHRVVGSHGILTGYAGGLEAKKLLLEIEKEQKNHPI
ncbi:MAG: methylated-DNA--[protein]-cysteine S-methyltransferase [Lepagella sp.]